MELNQGPSAYQPSALLPGQSSFCETLIVHSQLLFTHVAVCKMGIMWLSKLKVYDSDEKEFMVEMKKDLWFR